ncbi:conserved hypothetical protein [uncultured Stenotrophomonas sp.]|uniref:Uncharacterized protein n=1 Tax=uncultured Stenotrophomonas sp. TaxID=165438 RepID=A0A1Y5Q8M2_9GAMM|nr:conserved hypothetical protein [uncultured Stenotrophomonas sp.]
MALAGAFLAGAVPAQQALPEQPAAIVGDAEDAFRPTPAEGDVTTLGEVRALKPEDDQPLDLYRFRNPVQVEDNRFSRSWSEPPTPEQVSLSGGYLLMGINHGLMAAAKGLHKLTNGRDQIQSAVARPPPELSEQQRLRAQRFCRQQQDCSAGD